MTDEKAIAPIQTTWQGFRFRSRTEARWGVFFTKAGIRFEYEKEGFSLASGPYLPDFWLPDFESWLEVKGAAPNEREIRLCEELSRASGKRVLLAVGAPAIEEQVFAFPVSEGFEGPFCIAADRRNDGQFWLSSPDAGMPLNSGRERHDRHPIITPSLQAAYDAARAERFDGKPSPDDALSLEKLRRKMRGY